MVSGMPSSDEMAARLRYPHTLLCGMHHLVLLPSRCGCATCASAVRRVVVISCQLNSPQKALSTTRFQIDTQDSAPTSCPTAASSSLSPTGETFATRTFSAATTLTPRCNLLQVFQLIPALFFSTRRLSSPPLTRAFQDLTSAAPGEAKLTMAAARRPFGTKSTTLI
jgi:hypothetical protein